MQLDKIQHLLSFPLLDIVSSAKSCSHFRQQLVSYRFFPRSCATKADRTILVRRLMRGYTLFAGSGCSVQMIRRQGNNIQPEIKFEGRPCMKRADFLRSARRHTSSLSPHWSIMTCGFFGPQNIASTCASTRVDWTPTHCHLDGVNAMDR
ncbi:hypothetical protein BT63DRAFT_154787 [Microthyrium microscopicum]|uniref:Uncharacterized protein n=1 Tax=Microthyrium microscopicum TaxID=703497 RepID=A0A6A6UNU6_9PEZI|nr:hypothetical protein BT63DRAFT_154787 [Microthyrium microscopicum]